MKRPPAFPFPSALSAEAAPSGKAEPAAFLVANPVSAAISLADFEQWHIGCYRPMTMSGPTAD
jgi:hypothetical protein